MKLRDLLLGPLKEHPRRAWGALILLIFATGCDVLGPWLVQFYIDHHLVPHYFPQQALVLLALAYMTTQLAAAGGRYWQSVLFARVAADAIRDLRVRVFAHLLRLPQHRIDATPIGELTNRVTSDTDAMRDFYVGFLSSVLKSSVLLVGIFIAMTLIDVRLTLMSALLIPAGVVLIWIFQRLSNAAAMGVRQLRAQQSARLNEAIQGMPIIQMFRQGPQFLERFDRIGRQQYRLRLNIVRFNALLLRSGVDLLSTLVLAGLIYGFGITQLGSEHQAIGIGVLYAFIAYLGRVSEPLMDICQRFSLYQRASVAGQRLINVLETPVARVGRDQRPIEWPQLELRELRFRHQGAARDTLQGISAVIAPGTFVGIVGATGSGKSTLLDVLCGLKPISDGELLLDGRTLSGIAPAVLSDTIAVVPQEPFLRSTTLRDNILLGLEVSDDALAEAVSAARLDDVVATLPKGLDTPLGERGLSLSSGERQLLALARALLRKPAILMLDEATASIDSATEAELGKALDALHGKVTLIVVAHRLATIAHADHILVMENGVIAEEGRHEALLERPEGRYRQLWQSAASDT
ncbi:ABC transporter ATP-binding protein [Carnimonas nigrificans]|uniref:ABC transporter ATP-binding protein n=1 Tax=Carnimonas nigrificans TaxID=64323 RepID=UPI0004B6AC53|nr:ABC transporter transmembrane domain-containing protein [Carnimonas nigrificans]